MSGYDDLLAAEGMDHAEFVKHLRMMENMHVMAQNAHMAFIQRCFDLEIPAPVAMLCIYQIARFQVKANMAEGNIQPHDINGSKVLMDLLRELRHPDGKYPRLMMDEDGNFRPDGTHAVAP